MSVGCVPSKALLRNAELAHLVNGEAKPLASTSMAPSVSTIRFDHVAAFRRSRKVADGRVRGVHFLMKKDDITELTGHGTFLDPRTCASTSPVAAPKRSPSRTPSSPRA